MVPHSGQWSEAERTAWAISFRRRNHNTTFNPIRRPELQHDTIDILTKPHEYATCTRGESCLGAGARLARDGAFLAFDVVCAAARLVVFAVAIAGPPVRESKV